jgi:hypothetical protein
MICISNNDFEKWEDERRIKITRENKSLFIYLSPILAQLIYGLWYIQVMPQP